MSAQQKVVVLKPESRVQSRSDVTDREFWLSQRQALLIQVAAIEKRLGILRRCKECGTAQ